jgi:ribose transport system substrate-binding protein
MIALHYLRHEPVPKEVAQPTIVITKDNLAPYDVSLDSRTCPSWDQVPKN